MSRATINLTSIKGRALRLRLYQDVDFTCPECGWVFTAPVDYDGHYCLSDWSHPNEKLLYLAVDHVVPVAKGGTDDESNLRALCNLCNSRKGSRLAQAA